MVLIVPASILVEHYYVVGRQTLTRVLLSISRKPCEDGTSLGRSLAGRLFPFEGALDALELQASYDSSTPTFPFLGHALHVLKGRKNIAINALLED